MTERVIFDKELIRKIVRKDAKTLTIQYDIKAKKAYFQTDTMSKKNQ